MSDLEKRVRKLEKEMEEMKKIKKLFSKFIKFFNSFFGGDEYKDGIREKNKEIEEYKNSIASLEQELESKNREIKELKNENNKLKSEVDKCKKYENIEKLEELYENLSKSAKDGLKNVLKGESLTKFISGVNNIESIWNYAKFLREEHKDRDFEIVRDIFYLLFEEYKKLENVNFQEIKEVFDVMEYMRDNRSTAQSARIKEVILRGYLKNNKLIKKSIVLI